MSAPFIPTCPPQPPFPGTGRIPAATPEPVIPPVPGRIPPTPPVVTVNGVRPDADGDVHIPIVDATAVRIVEQDLTEEQKTTARSNIGIPDVLSSKADLEDGKVPSSQLPDPAVVDSTVTETSSNAVKSSGIWTWVKGLLPSWLTSSFPQPITSHQDLSGIEDELAEKVVAAEVTEYRSDITLTSGGASAIHLFSSEPNPVPAQIDLAKSYVEGGYDSSVTLGTDSGVPAVIVKWKASSSARLYNSFCVYGNGSASRTISGTKTTAEYSFVQYTGKDTTVAPKANALTSSGLDTTLTVSGKAADAEAVGEALSLRLRTIFGNAAISWNSITGCLEYTAPSGECIHFPASAFDGTSFATLHDPAPSLTDDGVTALFASSVSSTTSTTLKDRDCSVVAYSSGMTLTFTASTGLRQFEILITDCTAGGSINFPDVTYRGASDALTLEAGDNHLVFAEYAANCFFVTRSVANTITIS